MSKNILKNVLMVVISIILIFQFSTSVMAESKKELNNMQDELDGKIDETQEKINEIQEQKSETMQAVEKLMSEIADYENQIAELDEQKKELENKISVTEDEIEQKEKEYAKQQDLFQKRLITMYEGGETTYLEVLLSSSSIADFLSRYYLLTELAEQDDKLLEEIQKSKEEIQKKKDELEANKQEVQNVTATKKEKNSQLKAAKAEKEEQVANLTEQEKQAQTELEEFEQDKKDIAEKLRKIAEAEEAERKRQEEEARKAGKTVSSSTSSIEAANSGYISPLAGTTRANITCGFYGYSTHTGADFGGHYGEAVRAVKDGTVVVSEARTGTIPNYSLSGTLIGSYRSYGEYIIINHHDGTMTLYAHGKPGSRLVKEGDTVKQGQQIMTVGNTGNVTPRPTASNPKGGAHLHFEVWKNKVPVNPAPYLP